MTTQPDNRQSWQLPPHAGRRLILVALVIAAAIIVQAILQRHGFQWTPALVVAFATLWGGWLLNAQARVPGLPMTVAGLMALAILVTELIGTADAAVSGGTVFIALMLSAVAGSWAVGLVVAVLLVGAALIAVAT